MRTSAIPLSEFEPNAQQLEHLERSFTAALGPRWKDNQYKGRILDARNDRAPQGWTVYWSPIPPFTADMTTNNASQDELGLKPDPDELTKRGVLVVWPTHLTLPLIPQQSPSSSRVKRKRPVTTLYDLPQHSDLMDTASGLFDFMSTYKESPPPSEPTPATVYEEAPVVDMPTPATGPTGTESTPKIPFDADHPTVSVEQDEGDIDDLFSSNPTSPLPVPLPKPIEHGTVDDFDDLFGGGDDDDRPPVELDKDFDMDEPDVQIDPKAEREDGYGRYAGSGNGNGNGVGEDQGGILITEDDFDFFDSPAEREAAAAAADNGKMLTEDQAARVEVELKGDNQAKIKPEDHALVTEATDSNAGGTVLTRLGNSGIDIGHDQAPLTVSLPSEEYDTSAKLSLQRKEDANASLPHSPTLGKLASDKLSAGPITDRTGPLDRGHGSPHSDREVPTDLMLKEAQPISPASPFDIIPSDFSPLPSIQAPILSQPIYTFPTPATTPESLRVDLVERLRQSKKQKGASDYTSTWNVEDEPSEAEEEYDDSGAPPTPASEMITDDEDVKDESLKMGKKESEGIGVDWNGMSCLGAEWIWVKDDAAVMTLLGQQWSDDWNLTGKDQETEAGLLPPLSPPSARIILDDNMDLDRIATEMVSNRYFRKAVLSGSIAQPHAKHDMGYLDETGITLSHLLDPAEHATPAVDENSIRELGSCNVHAGFAGNVMRLSIAGIQYWRQLGLSPVGDEKEVEAMVATTTGSGMKRAAELFLAEMEKVWAELRLGRHVIKDGEQGGVVQFGPTDIATKLSKWYT